MAQEHDFDSMPSPPVIVDTRAHPRYATTMMVRIGNRDTMIESRGNISLGGFYFETKLPLHAGQEVEILFRLPGAGLWMKGHGEVIGGESTESAWAVRGVFKEFDPADIKALNTWMQFITRSAESDLPFPVQDPRERTVFTTEHY